MRQLLDLPGFPAVEAGLDGVSLIYLSGITLSLFDPASRRRLFALLGRLRAGGARIAFDTNFRSRGWPDRADAVAAFDRRWFGRWWPAGYGRWRSPCARQPGPRRPRRCRRRCRTR